MSVCLLLLCFVVPARFGLLLCCCGAIRTPFQHGNSFFDCAATRWFYGLNIVIKCFSSNKNSSTYFAASLAHVDWFVAADCTHTFTDKSSQMKFFAFPHQIGFHWKCNIRFLFHVIYIVRSASSHAQVLNNMAQFNLYPIASAFHFAIIEQLGLCLYLCACFFFTKTFYHVQWHWGFPTETEAGFHQDHKHHPLDGWHQIEGKYLHLERNDF